MCSVEITSFYVMGLSFALVLNFRKQKVYGDCFNTTNQTVQSEFDFEALL